MLFNENMLLLDGGTNISVQLNLIQNKKALYIFRAINHSLRLKMLAAIHEKQTITVTHLYKAINVEQAVASQHLAILRRAGFVMAQRRGKQIYYSICYNKLQKLTQLVNDFLDD